MGAERRKKMSNGFVLVARDCEEGGVHVETTDDWEEYMSGREWRLIYCQAVSDLVVVREKVAQWLEEEEAKGGDEDADVNNVIAEAVSSLQWIANEHPLTCFHRPS